MRTCCKRDAYWKIVIHSNVQCINVSQCISERVLIVFIHFFMVMSGCYAELIYGSRGVGKGWAGHAPGEKYIVHGSDPLVHVLSDRVRTHYTRVIISSVYVRPVLLLNHVACAVEILIDFEEAIIFIIITTTTTYLQHQST